jgi:hypothetical protein
MNFELKGKSHDYKIEDDQITISKNKDVVYSGDVGDVTLLSFVKKNVFGAGQIVMSLPDREKVYMDSFRENHRNGYIGLFEALKDKTEFLDLNYIEALKYVKPEVKKEKELQEAAKKEQRNQKVELLKQGFKIVEETKCTCTRCNEVWYCGNQDKLDNISNGLISAGAFMQGKSLTGTYHEQLVKDSNQCPKCGSRAIAKEKVKYWFHEKKGESVEYKE